MRNSEKISKRNGMLLLILGTIVLFSGLALWGKAESTYYVTQFAILVIWCLMYGFALITIGIVLLNIKSKIKWVLITIVFVFLIFLTPVQKISTNGIMIEYKAISYSVTESINEDGKSYQKVVKFFGKTIQDKTIVSDSLSKKFHIVIY